MKERLFTTVSAGLRTASEARVRNSGERFPPLACRVERRVWPWLCGEGFRGALCCDSQQRGEASYSTLARVIFLCLPASCQCFPSGTRLEITRERHPERTAAQGCGQGGEGGEWRWVSRQNTPGAREGAQVQHQQGAEELGEEGLGESGVMHRRWDPDQEQGRVQFSHGKL